MATPMNRNDPSISVWIDDATREATYRLVPQKLSPTQYGLVIGGLIAHLVKLFMEANPNATEQEIASAIRTGIESSAESRQDFAIAAKPH